MKKIILLCLIIISNFRLYSQQFDSTRFLFTEVDSICVSTIDFQDKTTVLPQYEKDSITGLWKPIGDEPEEKISVIGSKINITKGIITFDVSGWSDASGHFTLWDGNHLIYPGGAEHDDPQSSKYYFHMLYPTKKKNGDLDFVQTNRIRIWELK